MNTNKFSVKFYKNISLYIYINKYIIYFTFIIISFIKNPKKKTTIHCRTEKF